MVDRRFRAAAAALALLLPAGAHAQVVFDQWKDVAIPPPPALTPVTLDPARTALLVLDMSTPTCSARPSCVRSVPAIARLLDQARSRGMLVVFSTGAPNGTTPPVPPIAPLVRRPEDPLIRVAVDKFTGSDLTKILSERKVDTVVVTGTSAEGAVLYTASGAALRGLRAIVPVDTMSAIEPFAEIYTAWHLKNAPRALAEKVTLTRTSLITFR